MIQASEATVPAGAALLDVGDPSRMEVVSELLTTDAVQAQPGRRVVIERWGGPPVEGLVRRVEPAAFTKVSALGIEEQRVNVLIDITAPPQTWRAMGDGFRVGVRIVTASVDTGGARAGRRVVSARPGHGGLQARWRAGRDCSRWKWRRATAPKRGFAATWLWAMPSWSTRRRRWPMGARYGFARPEAAQSL